MRLLLLVLLLCLGTATAALADPFGRPADAGPTMAQDSGDGPSALGGLIRFLARTQNRLNGWVSHEIRAVKDSGSPAAFVTVLAVAFFWGVLHAAGPGHGKSLVAAYLLSTEARWSSGIVLGGAISLLQGLTAIVAVLVLAAVLHELQTEIRLQGAVIELFSYGLVALLGLVMLWQAATGRGHAHHHHGPPVAAHGHGDEHGHRHHHEDCGPHDHDDGAHRHARGIPVKRRTSLDFGRVLTLFAGIAPCASAIIIMLFALANGALLIGAAAVFALSLGMGLTVAAVGVLSVVARGAMKRLAAGSSERGELIERLLAIAGAIAVIGFSGLLALGAWDQLSSPI